MFCIVLICFIIIIFIVFLSFSFSSLRLCVPYLSESESIYTSTLNSIYINLMNNACTVFVNIFFGTK